MVTVKTFEFKPSGHVPAKKSNANAVRKCKEKKVNVTLLIRNLSFG